MSNPFERLLLYEAIGETRAIAVDAHGRAAALYHDRWADHETRLRWGEVHSGVIRKLSRHDGGAFIVLEGGQEGFFAQRELAGLVEGQRAYWRIKAEARDSKLATLSLLEANQVDQEKIGIRLTGKEGFAHWLDQFPGRGQLRVESSKAANEQIDAAFDAALAPIAPLPGGGRLQISPTPALVAVDVDTLGRRDKGRATARARNVGCLAAEELARQAVLRKLGGPIVLDCIGPLARRDGPALKESFLKAFASLSSRRANCLPPSPFGLMEMVLEWRWQPLREAYFMPDGQARPLAALLDGFRQVEREAQARPADRLSLNLPLRAYKAFLAHRKIYEKALIDRLGGRIEVIKSDRDYVEVTRL